MIQEYERLVTDTDRANAEVLEWAKDDVGDVEG